MKGTLYFLDLPRNDAKPRVRMIAIRLKRYSTRAVGTLNELAFLVVDDRWASFCVEPLSVTSSTVLFKF